MPPPRNAPPVDYLALRQAHLHAPLVWMLVLTQLSVGAFCVALLAPACLPNAAAATIRPWQGAVAMALGLLALRASTSHLGHPFYAFRAVLGVRTSWLSREILVFGGFGAAAVGYAVALFHADSVGDGVVRALGASVVVFGAGGVFCSAMLYHSTKREWWNGATTGFKFFMTAVVLGLAVGTAIVAVVGAARPDQGRSVLSAWLTVAAPGLAIATGVKLLGESLVFTHLKDQSVGGLQYAAALMAGELRSVTFARGACALLGGVALPLIAMSAPATVPLAAQSVLALLALAFVLAGELAERLLFFAAMNSPHKSGMVT